MPSRWTPYQFQQIKRAFPEFKALGARPSLDSIVVAFLEKYEVYVTPATTSDRRTGGEAASDAFFGAMSGATGNHEYAADAAIIRNQAKGAAVQEWTQWKQWALDHKDFEAFRTESIEAWEKLNNRLESDEFAEEWATKEAVLQREYEEQNIKDQKFFYTCFFITLTVVVGISAFIWVSDNNRKSDQKTSQTVGSIELIAS